MIKRISIALTALCLSVIVAASTSQAQSRGKLVAKIPFEFIVGNARLPAGDYTVEQFQAWGSPLLVRSVSSDAGAFSAATLPVCLNAIPQKPKLVFHQYGDRYFLAQVWAAGSDEGRKLFRSRLEGKMEADASADDFSKDQSHYKTVTILAEPR